MAGNGHLSADRWCFLSYFDLVRLISKQASWGVVSAKTASTQIVYWYEKYVAQFRYDIVGCAMAPRRYYILCCDLVVLDDSSETVPDRVYRPQKAS
jgi:hypothetical protein